MSANIHNGISHWEKSKFKDIAKFLNGRAYKADEFKEFGTPIVRIQNLTGEGITVYSDLILAEDKYIENGDLIYAWSATFGPYIWKGDKSIYHYHIWKVLCNERKIDKLFFFYYLKNTSDALKGSGNGTLFVHITKTLMESFEISHPSIPEQKAIAAVLSSLDDKIDLLHRQNKTLEAMAETLFRQWFVEEAREEWEDTNLETHTEIFRGLSYKGSGLSDVGIGLPMHNLNSIYEGGGYKETGIKYYSGEYKERHLVSPGDIIVANTEQGHNFRLIGFPAIVPSLYEKKGLFSQHLYRLILKEKSCLTIEYIYYLLMVPFVREQVISATNGSTVNMLASDGLQRPEFKLPSKEKVDEFSKMVRNWWKKKELNHSQIRTLEQLRDTLLPKLMSGEVRVAV